MRNVGLSTLKAPATINLLRTSLSGGPSEMMFSNSCWGCIGFLLLLGLFPVVPAWPHPQSAAERPWLQNETWTFPVVPFTRVSQSFCSLPTAVWSRLSSRMSSSSRDSASSCRSSWKPSCSDMCEVARSETNTLSNTLRAAYTCCFSLYWNYCSVFIGNAVFCTSCLSCFACSQFDEQDLISPASCAP